MIVFLLALLLLFTPKNVFADRITVSILPTTAHVGESGIEVTAKMLQSTDEGALSSTGERATIKIRNARDGDRCDTKAGGSDPSGNLHGTCYATQTGTMIVYIHSEDRGDDSSDTTLTFDAAPAAPPATATPAPTTAAASNSTASPTKSATTSAQTLQKNPFQKPGAQQTAGDGNPFIQPGLEGITPQADDGLASGSAAVAGANTTKSGIPVSDDLFRSYIFFSAAIVLALWLLYLLMQHLKEVKQSNRGLDAIKQTPPTPSKKDKTD
jgi:hypothetical protein